MGVGTNFSAGDFGASPGQTQVGFVAFQLPNGVLAMSVTWPPTLEGNESTWTVSQVRGGMKRIGWLPVLAAAVLLAGCAGSQPSPIKAASTASAPAPASTVASTPAASSAASSAPVTSAAPSASPPSFWPGGSTSQECQFAGQDLGGLDALPDNFDMNDAVDRLAVYVSAPGALGQEPLPQAEVQYAPVGRQFEQAAEAAPQSSPFGNSEFQAALADYKQAGAALAGITGDSTSGLATALNRVQADEANGLAAIQGWQSAVTTACP